MYDIIYVGQAGGQQAGGALRQQLWADGRINFTFMPLCVTSLDPRTCPAVLSRVPVNQSRLKSASSRHPLTNHGSTFLLPAKPSPIIREKSLQSPHQMLLKNQPVVYGKKTFVPHVVKGAFVNIFHFTLQIAIRWITEVWNWLFEFL